MIQLLFLVLFGEGIVAFLLLVKIGPLRELVMKFLEQVKIGKGPATLKTIACTMSVILLSNVISIVKIQNKGAKLGTMSPMDQVLWRTHLLEASLMGFTLFLGFLIDKMHHYLQKLHTLRSSTGALRDEIRKLEQERAQLKAQEEKSSKQVNTLQEQISAITAKLKKMELESAVKDEKLETAEVHVASLQKQAADLLLEYDRLLEDNQHLQSQGYRT
ncbi:unnamed protein product [Rhodiola kirilowii]